MDGQEIDWAGIYINLDARTDRRHAMEMQLSALGIEDRYERISATAGGSPERGWQGCYMSHLRALERVAELDRITHIAEDDIELTDSFLTFVQRSGHVWERFDILFLDMWVDLVSVPLYLKFLQEAYESSEIFFADLKGMRVGAASSYLVNPRTVPRLLTGLREQWRSSPTAVDTAYGRLAKSGEIRAAVTVPFLTGTSKHAIHSDIQFRITADEIELLLNVRAMFQLRYNHTQAADRICAIRQHLEGKISHIPNASQYLDDLLAFERKS